MTTHFTGRLVICLGLGAIGKPLSDRLLPIRLENISHTKTVEVLRKNCVYKSTGGVCGVFGLPLLFVFWDRVRGTPPRRSSHLNNLPSWAAMRKYLFHGLDTVNYLLIHSVAFLPETSHFYRFCPLLPLLASRWIAVFLTPLLFVDDWPSYLPVICGLLGLWFDLERVSVARNGCESNA
jgi:hypothetical protein